MTNAAMSAVMILAGVMSGEACVIGPVGEMLVGTVFLERVHSNWFPDSYHSVQAQGFRGFDPDPPVLTLCLASWMIDHYKPGGEHAALFILSEADRVQLGFPEGESKVCSSDGRWILHAYEKWPVPGAVITDGGAPGWLRGPLWAPESGLHR